MATITFDGPNKIIGISSDGALTSVGAGEIYSRWKDWVIAGNAQYLPAFSESVGGNPLSSSVSLSGYYFIRNDLGWRMRPAEADYQLQVEGDLYPFEPDTAAYPWVVPPVGDYTVLFSFQRSAASYVVAGGGAGAPTAGQVADAVWDEALSGHVSPGSAGRRLRDLLPSYLTGG